MRFINAFLLKLGYKLIRTTNKFDWMGNTYYFPLENCGTYIKDFRQNKIPLKFRNESEVRFVIRAIDLAITKVQ